MGSYSSADVKCPFYRRDDPKTSSLTCEGVLPGGSIKSWFGTKEALTRQIRAYCAGNYESCPWFHIVSYKWEKQEH
jgi:hypothetical protein